MELVNDITIRELVYNKGNINILDGYLLRHAVYRNDIDITKVLLQHNADVNAENDACICYATYYGYNDMTKLLIENKANIHARDDIALYNASDTKNKEIVKLLLYNNANINKIKPEFVDEFMNINSDNLSYLFELDQICDLSEFKFIDEFIIIKNDIINNIPLNIHLTKIIMNYI